MEKEKNKTKKVNRLKALFDIRWWFYDFVKVTGFIPVSLFLRTKYTYINKKQKKEFNNEPIMIAANHKDFLDPFLMVSVMWFKRVAVIATKELFEGKLKKALFTGFKAICIDKENVSIRDINRRVAVGNFYGSKKLLNSYKENPCKKCESKNCEKACIRKSFDKAVSIKEINSNL